LAIFAAMNEQQSKADGVGNDPLGPVKALTGLYLRMGMPGVMRPRLKSLGEKKKSDTIC